MANDIISQVNQTVGASASYGKIVNENGYRYEGSNPNNYVCFGSDASPCPADNLYRIIGVFNEYNNSSGSMQQSYVTKLVKDTAFPDNTTTQKWHNNAMDTSGIDYSAYGISLIKDTLNNNYYNSINNPYKSMIVQARWWTGLPSNNEYGSFSATQYYNNERNSGNNSYPYWDGNIGIMYYSDYAYSSLAINCDRNLTYHNECLPNNWMRYNDSSLSGYIASGTLWTISRLRYNDRAYIVELERTGTHDYQYPNNSFHVKPCLYLNSSIIILSGIGTNEYPYLISKSL